MDTERGTRTEVVMVNGMEVQTDNIVFVGNPAQAESLQAELDSDTAAYLERHHETYAGLDNLTAGPTYNPPIMVDEEVSGHEFAPTLASSPEAAQPMAEFYEQLYELAPADVGTGYTGLTDAWSESGVHIEPVQPWSGEPEIPHLVGQGPLLEGQERVPLLVVEGPLYPGQMYEAEADDMLMPDTRFDDDAEEERPEIFGWTLPWSDPGDSIVGSVLDMAAPGDQDTWHDFVPFADDEGRFDINPGSGTGFPDMSVKIEMPEFDVGNILGNIGTAVLPVALLGLMMLAPAEKED